MHQIQEQKDTFEQTWPFLSLDAAALAFAYHPGYYCHAFPSFVWNAAFHIKDFALGEKEIRANLGIKLTKAEPR